jgi:superfamily II DNA or RNA helicase
MYKLVTKKSPRPHQLEAIQKGKQHFTKFDNGIMVMPCGSGKTLTSLWIADAIGAKRTIIVIPTLQLQGQALAAWYDNFGNYVSDHNIIVVGSDVTIGKGISLVSGTDSVRICEKLKEVTDKPLFVLTTYNSSRLLVDIALSENLHFDFCIFDEAHHTAGPEKNAFQALLRSSELKIAKRLFMTATPKVLQAVVGSQEERILSMNDERVYGSEFYRLTVSEAIERKIICEYKIATLFTDSKDTADFLSRDLMLQDRSGIISRARSNDIAVAISIVKAIQRFGLEHIIVFTATIKGSIEFKKLLEIISTTFKLRLDVFQLDGNRNEITRSKILGEFYNSKRAVITNAKLLGEGFDMPAVDAVAFASDKSSVIDIVQAAGRAWRRRKDKEFGYILIPCVLDKNRNPLRSDFLNLRRVVAALSLNDNVLYDYIRRSPISIDGKSYGRFIIENEMSPIGFDVHDFYKSLRLTVWRNLRIMESLNSDWVPWERAAEFTMSLGVYGIRSYKDWKLYLKNPSVFDGAPEKPMDIPSNLRAHYGQNYKANLFFSKPKARGGWAPIEEAEKFCMSLSKYGVTNSSKYIRYCKNNSSFPGAPARPFNIPSKPWRFYGEKFSPTRFFSDPLNNTSKAWRNVKECKKFIRSLEQYGVTNYKAYLKYCSNESLFPGAPLRPFDVPSNPRVIYKQLFNNEDFFPKSLTRSHLSWREVAKFTKSLGEYGVVNHVKWNMYFDNPYLFPGAPPKPVGIPKMIRNVYKKYYVPSKFFSEGNDIKSAKKKAKSL